MNETFSVILQYRAYNFLSPKNVKLKWKGICIAFHDFFTFWNICHGRVLLLPFIDR